jgi:hypothetical protein
MLVGPAVVLRDDLLRHHGDFGHSLVEKIQCSLLILQKAGVEPRGLVAGVRAGHREAARQR